MKSLSRSKTAIARSADSYRFAQLPASVLHFSDRRMGTKQPHRGGVVFSVN